MEEMSFIKDPPASCYSNGESKPTDPGFSLVIQIICIVFIDTTFIHTRAENVSSKM